jgi:sec-independent protein translocase protein TatC
MTHQSADPDQYKMGLLEHLRELRKRLGYSLLAILIGAIGAYYYSGQVFEVLCAPFFKGFGSSALIGTSPAEAWILKVKVAIFCGTLAMSPVLFYQLWAFVAPGLYESERKLAIPFVVLSSALFIGGAVFCYYTVLPLTFSFFYQEFLSIKVLPTIRIGDHLSLTIMTLVGFGLVFELPLATFILARAGIIDHTFLVRWYRQAVVIIFIVAAILTPPDVLTQLLMAGPLLLLYGLSIVIARWASRKPAHETLPQPAVRC